MSVMGGSDLALKEVDQLMAGIACDRPRGSADNDGRLL